MRDSILKNIEKICFYDRRNENETIAFIDLVFRLHEENDLGINGFIHPNMINSYEEIMIYGGQYNGEDPIQISHYEDLEKILIRILESWNSCDSSYN